MVAATGQTFNKLLRTHIFDRTSPRMRTTKRYPDYKFWNPGSNVYSTAQDYQRFLDAYFNGRLVSATSQQMIESDEVLDVRIRWFIGAPRVGRPEDVGNFGFGVWRSVPKLRKLNPGWCGYEQPCSFAPSHYESTAVLVRSWGDEAPKVCRWKHSQSCKFYYHIQNFGKDATVDAFNRNQRLSAQVESLVSQILSGASDPWACVAWNAEDNQTILATHNVPEVQRGLCLNKSAVSIDREFGFRGPNPTLVAAAPGCDPCWCCQRPRFDIQLA